MGPYRCIACSTSFPTHTSVCTSCFENHCVVLVGSRPLAAVDHEPELTNARELAKATWKTGPLVAYPDLVVGHGALVVLVGPPGSGKSSMVSRALDGVKGTTLLLSVEEPNGPSLADRFARLAIKRDDFMIASRATVDQIASIVREHKVVALGIDSVQRSTFVARDLRHLLATLHSLTMLFAVSQVNRDGATRGGPELEHEGDVTIDVEELRWTVRKSRYQPTEPRVSGGVLATPKEEADHAA